MLKAFTGTGRLVVGMILCALPMAGITQDDAWRVERIRVVPENVPILNIHVDDENIKWVANARTLYKVEAKDQAVEVPVAAGEMSLLQLPGGNHDIRWNTDAMARILGTAKVTTAAYDFGQKILWIGTNGYGVFKMKTNPDLSLIEQLHIDNSKLRSDFINSIFIARNGKVWIATEDGAVSVHNNQWTHHQRFFNILRIRGRARELWAIGDDLIWIIDAKENWTPIDLNRREIEGEIHDIAVDPEGRVWIASNIMTAYKPDTDRYQRFGPGQYFTSQFVNFVSVDDDATIWVGTNDKGLYIIEKESTITVTSTMENYLDCNGTSQDAAFSVRAIGGKPPYSFVWDHGVTGDRLSGLGPGKYRLTVTDTEGSKKSAVVEIADPFLQLVTVMDRSESDEGTGDGAASVKVSGGAPPYTYEWYSGFGEASATSLSEGIYGVTVTDAAGCSAVDSVEVIRQVRPMTVSFEQKQFNQCTGDATAIVAVSHTGGKGPFSYTWSNGAADQAYAENLAAGKYSVTVTDVLGNTASNAITIEQPIAIHAVIRIESPASANMTNGVATVTCTGGIPPYLYLWDNGETTPTASQLSPRRHELTVTDASGCSVLVAVDISENILPLNATISQTGEIRCAGQTTAGLEVKVEGGKKPFKYDWNKPSLAGSILSGLGAGEFTVTITDAAGGTATAKYTIKEPPPIVAVTIAEAPALAGTNEGHAIVRAEGGTGTLQYHWDNGEQNNKTASLSAGQHQVTVTDDSGCSVVAQVDILENILKLKIALNQTMEIRCAGETTAGLEIDVEGGKGPYDYQWSEGELTETGLSNLGAGDYGITVTDVTGASASARVTIREPAPLRITVIAESPALTGEQNGKASVRVEGGTGAYTYVWDNGDQGTITETLNAGPHTVTVTDASGCWVAAGVEIPENIPVLTASISQVSGIKCFGETSAAINVEVEGGKGPYAYQWNRPEIDGSEVTGLAGGEYAVTVSDVAGGSAVATLLINEPAPLTATAIAESPALTGANNGQAVVRVEGGTPPFTFAWDNGEQSDRNQSLGAGMHSVTVTDASGCSVSDEVEIAENILALELTLEQTDEIKCPGDETGRVRASITGGKEPFSLSWSNGAINVNEIGSLSAGNYTLSVVDVAGNSIEKEIEIKEPRALSVDLEIQGAAGANMSDGKATAHVGGGTPPYRILWSNGESQVQASALGAGVHTVSVTDAHGCVVSAEVTMTEDVLPLQVKIIQTSQILCAGQNDGAIETTVSGGKSPYTFSWNDGSDAQQRQSLKAGEYTVEVVDAAEQKSTVTYHLPEPEALSGSMTDVRAATHERIQDGKATALVRGGNTPFTFLWDNQESAARAVALSVGTHVVTVTDANGCSITLQTEVVPKILPELTAENLEKGEAVRMEQLQFEADSSTIDPSSMPTLEELYAFLYDNPTIVVEVGGHTNGLPEHDYCDRLSAARAKAVAEYIIDMGIDTKRIVHKGYGKRQPIATNMTPEGRRRNQRVEVRIVKLSE